MLMTDAEARLDRAIGTALVLAVCGNLRLLPDEDVVEQVGKSLFRVHWLAFTG